MRGPERKIRNISLNIDFLRKRYMTKVAQNNTVFLTSFVLCKILIGAIFKELDSFLYFIARESNMVHHS